MERYKVDDYAGPTSAPIFYTLEDAQAYLEKVQNILSYSGGSQKLRIIELDDDYQPEVHLYESSSNSK